MKKNMPVCMIETAVKPPQSKNMTNLPSKILERKDLAMIVTGSLACIRGIYKTAASLGKLHQLYYCVLDNNDYNSEAWIEKYANIINKVLQKKGLGGIIVYAGCLDTLAKVSLKRVRPLLNNPTDIPVEILFRGPLSTATRKPKDVLPEILAKIPPTDGVLSSDGFVLPPPQPDFTGVAAMTENCKNSTIVLDIGGCSACIAPSCNHSFENLKKTVFNGYAGLKQYKEVLDKAILQETNSQTKSCCILLETPVVQQAKLNISWLQESLMQKGLESVAFDTTGYKTSEEGVASVLVKAGEQAKRLSMGKSLATNPKLIGVLGANSGQSANRAKIFHGIEHFVKDGYTAIFPEDLTWKSMDKLATARINWVVSSVAIPLAEYMKKEFGIPYLSAVPVGARSMSLWRNRINQMMHNTSAELSVIPPVVLPARKQKKLLIVGDPILTAGIKNFFIAEEGYIKVDRAVYAPVPSFLNLCTQITLDEAAHGLRDEDLPIDDPPVFFQDTDSWQKLVLQYDVIVCDKLLQLCLGDNISPKIWINIPDGMLSNGLVKEDDYAIFGKKGAAWLRNAL